MWSLIFGTEPMTLSHVNRKRHVAYMLSVHYHDLWLLFIHALH